MTHYFVKHLSVADYEKLAADRLVTLDFPDERLPPSGGEA
jgi:hypothetical protein